MSIPPYNYTPCNSTWTCLIVVDNITYCWHNDLGKYYYCDDILDDVNEYYQVTPGKIFKQKQ